MARLTWWKKSAAFMASTIFRSRPWSADHAIATPVLNPLQKRMLAVRRGLAARGFNEAVTWSFIPEAHAKLFGGGQAELKLANAISSELTDMRPSLLPNLIAAAGRNMKRGFADLALARSGPCLCGRPAGGRDPAGGGHPPRAMPSTRNWQGGARAVDAFDAKADALAVLEAAGAATASLQVVAGAPAMVSIPAVPAPSRWGRRTSWRISAKSIRASWRPWM